MKLFLGLVVVAICLILAYGREGNPSARIPTNTELGEWVYRIEHQLERIERDLDKATLQRAQDSGK